MPENIIYVGKFGSFGEKPDYTSKDDIDALIKRIEDSGKSSVSLYFHGGLVNRSKGEIAARDFIELMNPTNSFPIGFVWETGLKEILIERILTINESPFFRKILIKALKKFAERYVPVVNARSGKAQITDQWIEAQLELDQPFRNIEPRTQSTSKSAGVSNEYERGEHIVVDEIQQELEMELEFDQDFQDAVDKQFVENNADGSKAVVSLASVLFKVGKIVWRVIKRFYQRRDHDIVPTVTEEILREFFVGDIGSEIWSLMKVKSENMWLSEFDDDRNGVANYLLVRLRDMLKERQDIKLNLVGHSAGSLALLKAYRFFRENNIENFMKEFILIAPAARVEIGSDTLHPLSHFATRVTVFCLSDERERGDHLIPKIYPASLLYFVSGLLEEEESDAMIMGMQRYWDAESVYGNIDSTRNLRDVFKAGSHLRVCFAPTPDDAPEGLRSNGMGHGEIDNEKTTLESIKYLIMN